MERIKQHLSSFLSLIYPQVCCVCGNQLVQTERSICEQCVHDLPKTNLQKVPGNQVEKLFWGKVHIEFATAFFYFQKGSVAQKILHQLKYKGNKDIGIDLGLHFGSVLSSVSSISTIDYIVPVPLHPNKFRKRGYNQSKMIAIGLSQVLNIPIETKSLIRCIENTTQTKKGVIERWTNTSDVFAVQNKEAFADKHILLVDDVLTTGSTVEACAKAILQTPKAKLSFVSLALASN